MADIHQFVAEMITTMGVKVSRQTAKTLNFLTLYGGGVGKLASQLNISVEQAQEIKNAYLAVFPALKEINSLMRTRGRKDEPIRTLGGRLYKAEPSKVIKGELREFSYKLLNILIQGSSADYTKQAMVRYDAARKTSRLLLNVHDEVVIMSPEEDVAQEMKILKEAMEGALPLDVPMLSAGETGYDWQNMEPYND
jgi:DNA polymerase-1